MLNDIAALHRMLDNMAALLRDLHSKFECSPPLHVNLNDTVALHRFDILLNDTAALHRMLDNMAGLLQLIMNVLHHSNFLLTALRNLHS